MTMNAATTRQPTQPDARTRLLHTAMQVIGAQGYSATTVDDICRAAGLTKGAFFHHFKSKEDLAVAAAQYFSEMAERLFGTAPYREIADPLDRLLGYIDFRSAIISGPIPEFTCLLGTMVQEAYDTHPAIRRACETYIGVHVADIDPLIPVGGRYQVGQQMHVGIRTAHEQDSFSRFDAGVNFRGHDITNKGVSQGDQMHVRGDQKPRQVLERH